MLIRYSKIMIIFALAFYTTLVVFGNVTNYSNNFDYVRHALLMDTIADEAIKYRSITSPVFAHLVYLFVIALELIISILFWISGFQMVRAVKESEKFKKAKITAILPLSLGFVLWQMCFMSIGGKWFGLWQSKMSGQEAAFRIVVIFLMTLIYITMNHDENN